MSNYAAIGNGLYVRVGKGPRKVRVSKIAPPQPKLGDRVIYRLRDGRMAKVEEPQRPDRANFVIVCEFGDWSGFRTLAECEKQFPELVANGRPNGYYEVVER